MRGMAITGIPPYQPPIEQSLRCLCGQLYVVYLGGGIGDAEERVRERATMLKAQFVNAQTTPWLVCSCGQVLDFMPEGSLSVQ
jgi:hypothetical protein